MIYMFLRYIDILENKNQNYKYVSVENRKLCQNNKILLCLNL